MLKNTINIAVVALLVTSNCFKLSQRDEEDGRMIDDLIDMEAVMEDETPDDQQIEVVNTKLQGTKAKNNDPKFAEVNALMSKYDKAEQRVRWLNSPEYL